MTHEAHQGMGPDRESGVHRRHTEKSKLRKRIVRGILYVLLILLCGAAWWQITLKGYEMAKAYIDQSVQAVRQENAVNVQELEGRIEVLGQEMAQLRESLDSAGSSISNSETVQERIDERLGNLDSQLKELEKSLKILKEAP